MFAEHSVFYAVGCLVSGMLFTCGSIFRAPSVQSGYKSGYFDSGWQTFGRVHNLQIAYKAGKLRWLKNLCVCFCTFSFVERQLLLREVEMPGFVGKWREESSER